MTALEYLRKEYGDGVINVQDAMKNFAEDMIKLDRERIYAKRQGVPYAKKHDFINHQMPFDE